MARRCCERGGEAIESASYRFSRSQQPLRWDAALARSYSLRLRWQETHSTAPPLQAGPAASVACRHRTFALPLSINFTGSAVYIIDPSRQPSAVLYFCEGTSHIVSEMP